MKIELCMLMFCTLYGIHVTNSSPTDENTFQQSIQDQLNNFDQEYQRMWWLHQSADWEYSTNLTNATANAQNYVSAIYSDWMRKWKLWARTIHYSDLPLDLQQVLQSLGSGVVFSNPTQTRLISKLKSQLTAIYSKAKIVIPSMNITLQGEAEVGALMSSLRNPDILKQVWKSWRIQVGSKAKPLYLQLLQLTNKAARENGYSDVGEAWRAELGFDDLMTTVLKLWNDVKKFYKELHAFTRFRLESFFGKEHINSEYFIPAHLLGSLWGENWVAWTDQLVPYPEQGTLNITSILEKKGYDLNDVLHKAEEFYISMGFNPMAEDFWRKSMFSKPSDNRIFDCHAVSYDFAMGEDFRVRMCGEVTEKSFMEMVHEMGHINYYKCYHKLPMIYRSGANSAFHEAIGETMVYAAQNPKCLNTLKIVESFNGSKGLKKLLLNTLMKQALSKFVLLPWALIVELWRYRLLAGELDETNSMNEWWKLRQSFQGIDAPDIESYNLFDPGSKYHVILHIPYMRYFLGRFLEHQFLDSLCEAAGENVHSCCFITNKKAAKKLRNMMSMGASVPWQEALLSVTGQNYISATPLMKYYQPLYEWLVTFNRQNNITIK